MKIEDPDRLKHRLSERESRLFWQSRFCYAVSYDATAPGWHTSSMAEDRVLLEGMVFHGYHGTLAAERELGQRFVVDLALYLELGPAGRADDLTLTVDYGEAHRRTREIVEGEPVDLTETVAERIAAALLADHPAVEAVRVKVAKPQVRLEGTVLAGSAVEILRRRG